MADPEPQVHQLKVALATNRVIATAVGLVMGKYRMDHEHALAHLTAKSEHTNVQLSRLALDLVSAAEGAVRRTRVSVSHASTRVSLREGRP